MRHMWVWRKSDTSGLFGNVAILMFVLVQCLDGILTYVAVMTWGIALETNPVASSFMSVMGVGLGLVVAKLVGVALGAILYWRGAHNAVAMLAAFSFIFVAL